ncbi:hypothetical protein ILYODFUR_016157 [Ilyodon furcidens]|uniref:Protein kinase domain-containing protein n=1 Tax=Ilyodon furcidens TaxID=33524 RepID=A0ABV0UWD1_9TELE
MLSESKHLPNRSSAYPGASVREDKKQDHLWTRIFSFLIMRKDQIRRIFQLEKGAILTSKTSTYRLKKILECGAFGLVVKCIKQETGETVAIKISHRHNRHYSQQEGKELKEIKWLGSEDYNIVKFYEEFSYRGQWCLVFELLDISLEDFTKTVVSGGLKLFDIRVITEQLLVALTFLKRSNRAHRDIKPDNVMVQDRKKLKVKLIDFSFLTSVRQMRNVDCCPQIYKSPEDHLNIDVDESVDMWNLGCTLAFLYLGDHLIDGEDDYETWLNIVTLLGHPEEDLLDRADTPFHFYTKIDSEGEQHWELRKDVLNMMKALKNKPSLVSPSPDLPERKIKSLDDIENLRPGKMTPDERKDLLCFIDLLKQMLVLDPLKRITPNEALKHNFITMEHFPVCKSNSPYVYEAREKMAIYKLPEGKTLGDSSATSPNSKTTTSDGVSPSSSSDSSSDTSVISTSPSWSSRLNEVRPKKRRNCKSPAYGMHSVPIWSPMATTPCSVYSDSLSSKTSSDSVYPASSCSKTSATNGVSSESLKSEASTPEGEFCDHTQTVLKPFSSHLTSNNATVSDGKQEKRQQSADQNEKILTSSLKKTSTMSDTTNTKEMTTKSSYKQVRFNPIVTYIDKQSLHPADISDQQEKIQTSSPKKSSTVTDVKTKNNCKVVHFNPAIFNTKATELADQINKQHKTKEPLTKGSENIESPSPR